MIVRALLPLLLLAGCGDLPRDPEGTLDRIRAERRFAVGIAGDIAGDEAVMPDATALLGRIQAATGARPAIERGGTEPLLLRLEAGELDLVVARFTERSPWGSRVTMTPALGGGHARAHVAAALRNGENAWMMLVEREARAVRGGAR